VDDGRVGDGVEGREPGGRADGTVQQHLSIDDWFWSGGGWNLLRPEIRGEEETFVCCEVVVDSEAALSEEHVCGVDRSTNVLANMTTVTRTHQEMR